MGILLCQGGLSGDGCIVIFPDLSSGRGQNAPAKFKHLIGWEVSVNILVAITAQRLRPVNVAVSHRPLRPIQTHPTQWHNGAGRASLGDHSALVAISARPAGHAAPLAFLPE